MARGGSRSRPECPVIAVAVWCAIVSFAMGFGAGVSLVLLTGG